MFSLSPGSDDFLHTLEVLLKIIAGLGGLCLFFIGIRRYGQERIWKRNEFVANEMKEFMKDRMVINVMYMLDWGTRPIELFPDHPDYKQRFIQVDRPMLKAALQYHELRGEGDKKDRFSEIEIAIRDHFDCFLSYLERFEHFIEAGLIKPGHLEPYLRYWIKTISKDLEEDVRNSLCHFIDRYEYTGTQKFFKRYGQNILPKTKLESTRMAATSGVAVDIGK